MIELILAWIGAITVVLVGAVGLFVSGYTLYYRLRMGLWWWDLEGDRG